jgi:hypothetical protein
MLGSWARTIVLQITGDVDYYYSQHQQWYCELLTTIQSFMQFYDLMSTGSSHLGSSTNVLVCLC